jgi:hypothetical protein
MPLWWMVTGPSFSFSQDSRDGLRLTEHLKNEIKGSAKLIELEGSAEMAMGGAYDFAASLSILTSNCMHGYWHAA